VFAPKGPLSFAVFLSIGLSCCSSFWIVGFGCLSLPQACETGISAITFLWCRCAQRHTAPSGQ
jgi:hypothetical protein